VTAVALHSEAAAPARPLSTLHRLCSSRDGHARLADLHTQHAAPSAGLQRIISAAAPAARFVGWGVVQCSIGECVSTVRVAESHRLTGSAVLASPGAANTPSPPTPSSSCCAAAFSLTLHINPPFTQTWPLALPTPAPCRATPAATLSRTFCAACVTRPASRSKDTRSNNAHRTNKPWSNATMNIHDTNSADKDWSDQTT
jgi:hypothetical protein